MLPLLALLLLEGGERRVESSNYTCDPRSLRAGVECARDRREGDNGREKKRETAIRQKKKGFVVELLIAREQSSPPIVKKTRKSWGEQLQLRLQLMLLISTLDVPRCTSNIESNVILLQKPSPSGGEGGDK